MFKILINTLAHFNFKSWGSSVSILADYGLDNQVQFPTEKEDFSSSLWVQTGSGAHPASCTMGTRGPFPQRKAWPECDADHLPPYSAKVENEYELYLLSPQAPSWRVEGHLYHFNFMWKKDGHPNSESSRAFLFKGRDFTEKYRKNIQLYIKHNIKIQMNIPVHLLWSYSMDLPHHSKTIRVTYMYNNLFIMI
jgi:hypothetical protein